MKNKAYKKIEDSVSALKEHDFLVSGIVERQYNYEVEVVNGKEKVKVQVYFGRKGVKTIIQGNSESVLHQKINSLLTDDIIIPFPKQTIDEPESYIGSDESGKGDIFGPLVTAAVFVTKETKTKLAKLGVRDSKELNTKQIAELAYIIHQTVGDNYELIMITPGKYNELYARFKNLNKLLNWSHSKAIENLLEKTDCKTVITDKFEKKNLAIAGSSKGFNINFIQTPKAERFTGVAAASIIARDAFNKWFLAQSKRGFDLPKGASNQVAVAAERIYKQKGEEVIQTLAKMHFKTIKKIKSQ